MAGSYVFKSVTYNRNQNQSDTYILAASQHTRLLTHPTKGYLVEWRYATCILKW